MMVLMPRVTIVDADKISDEAAAAVAEVSQTVNGALRVKLHDKHAALVSIGRYLGMFDDKASATSRCRLRSGSGSLSEKANELGVAAASWAAAGAGGVVAPSLRSEAESSGVPALPNVKTARRWRGIVALRTSHGRGV